MDTDTTGDAWRDAEEAVAAWVGHDRWGLTAGRDFSSTGEPIHYIAFAERWEQDPDIPSVGRLAQELSGDFSDTLIGALQSLTARLRRIISEPPAE